MDIFIDDPIFADATRLSLRKFDEDRVDESHEKPSDESDFISMMLPRGETLRCPWLLKMERSDPFGLESLLRNGVATRLTWALPLPLMVSQSSQDPSFLLETSYAGCPLCKAYPPFSIDRIRMCIHDKCPTNRDSLLMQDRMA